MVFVEQSWNTKESPAYLWTQKQVTEKWLYIAITKCWMVPIYCNLLPGPVGDQKTKLFLDYVGPELQPMYKNSHICGVTKTATNFGSGHQVCSVETFDSGIAIRFGQLLNFQGSPIAVWGATMDTKMRFSGAGHVGHNSVNMCYTIRAHILFMGIWSTYICS